MSPEHKHDEVEPVEVWEAPNRLEAEIVKGRLESEGIPAIIAGESAANVFGFATGELARASVLVPAPLVEKALAILQIDVDLVDEEDVEDEIIEAADAGDEEDAQDASDLDPTDLPR